jgi:hypothetical protein
MKSILTKLSLIALCVSFFPSQVIADGGFTGWRDIQWVYQRQCTPDRGFEIALKPPHANPGDCPNNFIIEIPCGVTPYDTAVDVALTALASGGQVRAFVNKCDGDGHAIVRALQARPAPEPEPVVTP